MSAAPKLDLGPSVVLEHALPSGRTLLVLNDARIEVRGPAGTEVVVSFDERGPVVTIAGAALELTGTRSIALRAPEVVVQADDALRLESRGTVNVQASKDLDLHSDAELHATAEMIWLN